MRPPRRRRARTLVGYSYSAVRRSPLTVKGGLRRAHDRSTSSCARSRPAPCTAITNRSPF